MLKQEENWSTECETVEIINKPLYYILHLGFTMFIDYIQYFTAKLRDLLLICEFSGRTYRVIHSEIITLSRSDA